MNTQFSDLFTLALGARPDAYAQCSKFAIGAAVRCKFGAIFICTKIENRSSGLTLCAEQIAMGTAVAVGERDFIAIAVTADSDEPIVPCGACRQFPADPAEF